MQFNGNRFRMFPELLKFTTLSTTILVILSLGAASYQPAGTTFVWITAILAIIVDCLCVLVIGFELETSLFSRQSVLGWPLVECVFSCFFAINYFISIWICVNSKTFTLFGFDASPTAYSLAATFSLANFIQYTLNVVFHVRIWVTDQRKTTQVIDPTQAGYSSFGTA